MNNCQNGRDVFIYKSFVIYYLIKKQKDMTKSARLKAFLNEYLPYVDSRVPTKINMGGCAVFALHLSDQLDKMQIPHTIEALIFDLHGMEREEISNLMKLINVGTGSFDISEDHVAIRVDDTLFDSLGSLCDTDGSFRKDIPKIKKLITIPKAILLKQVQLGHWLPVFDREQEPLIKHLLSKMPKALYKWEPGMYHGDSEHKKLSKYTRQEIVHEKEERIREIAPLLAMAGEMGIPVMFNGSENQEGRV